MSPCAFNSLAMIQKFHWAITGKTAAEIVHSNANAEPRNMGLTTWKNAPGGKILKSDTHIAKNYLQKNEIKELEELVSDFDSKLKKALNYNSLGEQSVQRINTSTNYPLTAMGSKPEK